MYHKANSTEKGVYTRLEKKQQKHAGPVDISLCSNAVGSNDFVVRKRVVKLQYLHVNLKLPLF